MKFKITHASDWYTRWEDEETVKISSMRDLKALAKERTPRDWKSTVPLIVDFQEKVITVYDDYVE